MQLKLEYMNIYCVHRMGVRIIKNNLTWLGFRHKFGISKEVHLKCHFFKNQNYIPS